MTSQAGGRGALGVLQRGVASTTRANRLATQICDVQNAGREVTMSAAQDNRRTKRLAKTCPPNVPLQVWVCQHLPVDDDGMNAEEDGPPTGPNRRKLESGPYFTMDDMRTRHPELFR